MGDKKKHKQKEKKKDKKKDKDEKKKKKDKYNSDSDDSQSDDSQSDSSRSNSKSKKDKKSKKVKKEKKTKKQSPVRKQAAPSANIPYDFNSVVPTAYQATIPGIKVPVIPPPLPSVQSTASVPKPKSKQPNIFKLLPKLHYGTVLFAKTIFCGEYLSQSCLDTLLLEMAKNIEQKTKEEQHKKGAANIGKCISELQKMIEQQKQQKY